MIQIAKRPQLPARPEDDLDAGGWRQPTIVLSAIITAVTLVVANVAALTISLTSERIYGGRVEIIFQPAADLSEAAADRELFTQEVILRSRAVLDPVARETRIAVKELEESLAIEIVNQTNVIRVTVAGPDRATARVLAQRIADTYSREVSSAGTSEYDRSAKQFHTRISQLAASASASERQLAGLASDPAVTARERDLQARLTTTRQLMTKLQDQLARLETERFTQPQAVALTQAFDLPDPLQPRPLQALAVGSLVGLFVAAGIVLVLLWLGLRSGADQWD
jgi:capsular polysaccharide biosynthesis protein